LDESDTKIELGIMQDSENTQKLHNIYS